MEYFVYILSNSRKNVIYVGSTCELKKRIYFHKKRLIAGFTRKYNVNTLVFIEKMNSLDRSLKREKQIKGLRREKKNQLININNPDWIDLYETL